LSNVAQLEELTNNDFSGILAWSDIPSDVSVKAKGLGVAYYTLRHWEGSIRCFETEGENPDNECNVWSYLGGAYMEKGDFDVEAFEKAIERDPTSEHAWELLDYTCTIKGNISDDPKIPDGSKATSRVSNPPRKHWAKRSKRWVIQIEQSKHEKVIEMDPNCSAIWHRLGRLYTERLRYLQPARRSRGELK
jgi:tetratricopeptide (TPR) repeat protein